MESRPIITIIQARMGSTRLPGKVLMPLAGRPVLRRVIDRVLESRKIDKVVVATSTLPADDPVAELAQSCAVGVFRGSEEDVLDRYYQAAKSFGAATVVRITADCPLLDPEILDHIIELFEKTGCDYATNTNPPTLPDGLDVEVFSFGALQTAWTCARKPSEREHVTGYIVHSGQFQLQNWRYNENLSKYRWTLDEPRDYEFIREVYENLDRPGSSFKTQDILALLKNRPELLALNSNISRNEGLKKSLAKDELFLRGLHA